MAQLGHCEESDFIQIRPWYDCINNCTFCYLQNEKCRHTTPEQKKVRLQKSAEFAGTLSASRLGLIGGEFFEGQLKGCEEEWFSLLETLKLSAEKVFITANLINDQHLLNETVDFLKKKLMLCTSYDEVGRFHTEEKRQNWFKRIDDLHSKGVELFCTCIATQDFFERDVELPDWLGVNLCDPQISTDWLINVDKTAYNAHLKTDQRYFNLPKRKDALKWFKKHPQAAQAYSDFRGAHSNTVYGFDENDNLHPELEERMEDDNFMNTACGHPHYAQCYADSPACMACDALRIAERFAEEQQRERMNVRR